jgi:hypothetical protein
VLLLVVELIGLTKGLTSYFAEIKREARQYTESHLQEHLVLPYRWRYWDELAGSASAYEKFEKSPDVQLNEAQRDEKLDQKLQRVNQTISTLPRNTDGTGQPRSRFRPARRRGALRSRFHALRRLVAHRNARRARLFDYAQD